jgi:uncharacterized protein
MEEVSGVRFAITGASGLVGSDITRRLRALGHQVTPVVRSHGALEHGERGVIWHPDRGVLEAEGLEGHDVVIHLAGESLAGVWTAGRKRRIRESRVRGTTLLAESLAGLREKPRVLFSASAMGIYGDHPPEREVDEATPAGTGFLADVARAWEAAATPAADAGIRVVNMRFGNVLSPDGGMLGALVPLYRLGLAASLGSGRQMWPWIALEDVTPALLHLLARPEISGPVNFVAPEPVSNAEFTDTLAAALGRPSVLKVPKFAVRMAPGGMADEMLLSGARLVPRRLLESGYEFRQPRLEPALRGMFG